MLRSLLDRNALRPALLAAVILAFLLFPGLVSAAISNDQFLENGPVAEGLVLQKRAVTINGGGGIVLRTESRPHQPLP